MKWSWKVGRIAGIEIYLHMTFLILIAWIGLAYWNLSGEINAVISGTGFILALFFCVLLHELGHALTARRFDIGTRSITLLPIGGIAAIEKTPDDPREEVIIALAGPGVSVAIAALLWLLLKATGGLVPLDELSLTEGSFLQRLMIINALLAAFNLLPAFPMDGGRVFRASLAQFMNPLKATRIAARVAHGFALLMAVIGLQYNLWLVLIAIFIWIGATTEASMAGFKSVLTKIPADKAMLKDFEVLEADESLERAIELTLAGTQKDFPVLRDGKVVGVLRQDDLLRGLHDHGKLCRVDQVMREGVPEIRIDESVEDIFERLQSGDSGLIIVTDKGRLAGLIDLDNVSELLRINNALEEHEKAVWKI